MLRLLILIIFFSTHSISFASNSNSPFYMGVAVGSSHYEHPDPTLHNDGGIVRIQGGVNFIETDVVDFGIAFEKSADILAEADDFFGFVSSIFGDYDKKPVLEGTALFATLRAGSDTYFIGKVGVTDDLSIGLQNDEHGKVYGAGVGFKLNRGFGLEAEFTNYSIDEFDVRSFSFGFIKKF